MAQIQYERPPITEATIELRFRNPVDATIPVDVSRKLKGKYGNIRDDNGRNYKINNRDFSTTSEVAWTGSRLSSEDQADVLILRTTSFICARLAPYIGWEQFRGRAFEAWAAWTKVAGNTALSRVGVRYMNRIDVPSNGNDPISPSDFVAVFPHLPPRIAGGVSSYAMQIEKSLRVDDLSLTLNTGTVVSPLIDHSSLVLDIDISREENIPLKNIELWSLLDRMRAHKNDLFESFVTDRSRELFL